jgi:prephenate dehydrogenase
MAQRIQITIVGVGLLGGSLALALKKQKGVSLVGWNHRASSRKKAARLILVAGSFEEAVKKANIIVLCSHSSSISASLRQLVSLVRPDTLILDVSSVKGEVVREANRIPGIGQHFVPCHPMAGKEKSGPSFADADIYKGKVVFITPLPKNPKSLVQKAFRFWKKVGAVPVLTDPRIHDRSVALTSHLPHILASVLMELYGQNQNRSVVFKKAVGSGFLDFTRIAAGNPSMWGDIVEMNAGEIKHFLSQYRRRLNELEKNLKKGKIRYWRDFFEKTRDLRERIS